MNMVSNEPWDIIVNMASTSDLAGVQLALPAGQSNLFDFSSSSMNNKISLNY
jgi:hypothetical protein